MLKKDCGQGYISICHTEDSLTFSLPLNKAMKSNLHNTKCDEHCGTQYYKAISSKTAHHFKVNFFLRSIL